MGTETSASTEGDRSRRLLEAVEALIEQISRREPEDFGFKVSSPVDVPEIAVLAGYLNRISDDWETRIRREEARALKRSIELSRAYEAVQAKNDEIQGDLDAARRVQLQLLPQAEDFLPFEEIDFAGSCMSKDKVGGDLYDFIRVGKNSWGFLVADISGHGVPSALLSMFLKAAFRTHARWGLGAEQVCRDVNRDLCQVIGDLGLYATAFFGIIDLETAILRYCNCGHPPAYLRRASSGEILRLKGKGMILGAIEEGIDLQQGELGLFRGDCLLATTDGVTESRNFLHEMFGEDRLLESIRGESGGGTQGTTALRLVEGLLRSLESFTLGVPPDDDITLACFRFVGRDRMQGERL